MTRPVEEADVEREGGRQLLHKVYMVWQVEILSPAGPGGVLERIRSDNGSALIARAVRGWLGGK